MENKLNIRLKDGTSAIIDVLDIIESRVFGKTFMLYTFEEDNKIFASILNENDLSYSLDTITSQEEINYINSEIDRVVASA